VGKGARFDVAFRDHYGYGLAKVWQEFLESLESNPESPNGTEVDDGA
jgi:hypothetical protein